MIRTIDADYRDNMFRMLGQFEAQRSHHIFEARVARRLRADQQRGDWRWDMYDRDLRSAVWRARLANRSVLDQTRNIRCALRLDRVPVSTEDFQ